jgi:hypothetical protein
LLGVTFVVAALLASQRRRLGLLKGVVVAGAATAGVAAVVLSVGVSLVPGKAASAAWESALVASSIAAAAVAAFAAARRARVAIAGFVAVLAALIGLGDVGVLVHGYVISSLPASVVRGATATAVGIGLVAAACAASLLFRGAPDPGPRERRFADAQRSMAIPRGKPRTS